MAFCQAVSCDGGGVRGILSARILQGFEEVKDGSICDYMDCLYGASTGSLVIAALASPSAPSAKKVVQLYKDYAPNIFSETYLQEAYSFNGLRSTKYTDVGLMHALHAFAGDTKFVNLTREVKFPAVDLTTGKQIWFSRDEAKAKGWEELAVVDVLRATTAAPTYFSGKILALDGVEQELLDGGISYNNPARKVVIDAFLAEGQRPNLTLLSVGTGATKFKVSKSTFESGGALQWIEPVLDIMGQFQEQISTDEARSLLADPTNLMRIQPDLEKEIPLDDATKLDMLEKTAADWLADHDDKFREFCKKFHNVKL